MKCKIAGLMFIVLGLGVAFEGAAQVKTGVLESRWEDREAGLDNYANATFSFIVGANGPAAQKLTRNDWDIQFTSMRRGEKVISDWFHVTMVTDDRSRIIDLGKREWSELIDLPELPAYEKPTREKDVQAQVGHMYYVHTADSDSDHYALFRVEEMKSGESVGITWKLVGQPAEGSK